MDKIPDGGRGGKKHNESNNNNNNEECERRTTKRTKSFIPFVRLQSFQMTTQWICSRFALSISIRWVCACGFHSLFLSLPPPVCVLTQIYGYKYFRNEMRKLYVIKANVCQTICFRSLCLVWCAFCLHFQVSSLFFFPSSVLLLLDGWLVYTLIFTCAAHRYWSWRCCCWKRSET